jgi:hypothetical protein
MRDKAKINTMVFYIPKTGKKHNGVLRTEKGHKTPWCLLIR